MPTHLIQKTIKTLVLTETGKPSSWDPLDADSTQNLLRARMVYAQLFTLDTDHKIISSILKYYFYDAGKRTLSFELGSANYSNGDIITTKDVVLSILRMLIKRPTFPVIEAIQGKELWLKSTKPLESLPSGINIKDKTIQITFDRNVGNPFFRLSLELFSVLPASLFNLEKNELKETPNVFSGPYTQAQELDNEIRFEKRTKYLAAQGEYPETIQFSYPSDKSVPALKAMLDKNTVILSSDALYTPEHLENLKHDTKTINLQDARFGAFLVNSKNGNFNKKNTRVGFADNFYSALQAIVRQESPIKSRSIFSELIPGYMTDSELSAGVPLKISSPLKMDVRVGKLRFDIHGIFYQTLEAMNPNQYNITISNQYKTREEMENDFINGTLDIIPVSSGFWPLDPVNDLKMFFAPNMHQDLFVLQTDKKLQHLIQQANESVEIKNALKAINLHLYENAEIVTFLHFHRFIVGHTDTAIQKLKIGAFMPSPWTLFEKIK